MLETLSQENIDDHYMEVTEYDNSSRDSEIPWIENFLNNLKKYDLNWIYFHLPTLFEIEDSTSMPAIRPRENASTSNLIFDNEKEEIIGIEEEIEYETPDLMPPVRKFSLKAIVTTIKRGKPSHDPSDLSEFERDE